MTLHTPSQLALKARVVFEIDVVDHGRVAYSFVTVGNRVDRRYAQLRAAEIARRTGARIFFRRRPLDRRPT